jgi:glycosyltransferase involved in cell wall biosynthesis
MIGWLRKPRIHLYAICWNEERMLPFFFRHYAPLVERFVIYDNGSTDRTLELLRARKDVDLRQFPWSNPNSFVESAKVLQNQFWKESRGKADWVIVTAIDEHIYHKHLSWYLRLCRWRGVTCIPTLGFEMVAADFPPSGIRLADHITRGVPDRHMNKLRIFDPNAVEEANFAPGGHRAAPTGRVIYPKRDRLLLFHYKNLGLDYRQARNELLLSGLRDKDRARNWGRHYNVSREDLGAFLDNIEARAIDICAAGLKPWRVHKAPRWWRKRRRAPAAPTPQPGTE